MDNILILLIIIIIFIIILFIDYNYCIENFAPKHKHKISEKQNIENFLLTDDLSYCLTRAWNSLCEDLDYCRNKEVNDITSKYTIDSDVGHGSSDKVHWINHNNKFYLNKVYLHTQKAILTLPVTKNASTSPLTNVYYCDPYDAICPAGKYLDNNTCTNCPEGTYKETSGDQFCTNCPAGKYSETVGATSRTNCLNCPTYSTSAAGSDDISDCLCADGYSKVQSENRFECEPVVGQPTAPAPTAPETITGGTGCIYEGIPKDPGWEEVFDKQQPGVYCCNNGKPVVVRKQDPQCREHALCKWVYSCN